MKKRRKDVTFPDEEGLVKPLISMIDEAACETYARVIGKMVAAKDYNIDQELKSWGHTGAADGHIIFKKENGSAIQALKDAVGKLLGGRAILGTQSKAESQSNGRIEDAGKTIKGFVRVMMVPS